MVDRADQANVLVQWQDLGDSTRLGSSPVGGPSLLSAYQLTVTFNPPALEGSDALLATACHEFGHVLGLTHVPTTGQLMCALRDPELHTPASQDIARAQSIWGSEETDWNSRLLQCNPWQLESLARRLGLNPALLPPRNAPTAVRVSSVLDMAQSRGKMPELPDSLEQVLGNRLVS